MADINKFLRSKDRLREIYDYLMNKKVKDEKTSLYINHVEESIKKIDHKMEEFKRKGSVNGQ